MSSDGARTESLAPPTAELGPSLPAGSLVLDRYRVERPIGRGGMGEVYEATHITLGSAVALKLPLRHGGSGSSAARLLREAKVAASLDPDRVARVLDVGLLGDGRPVIVLERLEGETLAERIARPPRLEVVEAVDYVIAACLGLVEAHARAIVHRDVKPSNLFLARRRDGSIVVKVLDFGVAALRLSTEGSSGEAVDVKLTDSQAPVGSPPYMAPEQLRGRPCDARTDVWGLGVTLFELLAGERPFAGDTAAAVGAAIVADPPLELEELRPDLPEGLAEVIRGCLAKDPKERPADAQTLARALAPFASQRERDQALASRPSIATTSAPQTSRGHPAPRATEVERTSATHAGAATDAKPRARSHRLGGWVAAGVLTVGVAGFTLYRGLREEPAAPAAAPEPTPVPVVTGAPESQPAPAASSAPAPAPEPAASSAAPAPRPVAPRKPAPSGADSAAESAPRPAPRIMDERKF
jgi:eukaryotic-like serine/threonine-protein kinase